MDAGKLKAIKFHVIFAEIETLILWA